MSRMALLTNAISEGSRLGRSPSALVAPPSDADVLNDALAAGAGSWSAVPPPARVRVAGAPSAASSTPCVRRPLTGAMAAAARVTVGFAPMPEEEGV